MTFFEKWRNNLDNAVLLEYAFLDAVEEYITSVGKRGEAYEFLGFTKEEWEELKENKKSLVEIIRNRNG